LLISHSTKRNQQSSILLRLPAELRNNIYSLVLGGKYITIAGWGSYWVQSKSLDDCYALMCPPEEPEFTWHKFESSKHLLSLLHTCRQVHSETRLLPFALNVFTVETLPVLGKWTANLGPRINAIHTVRISSEDHRKPNGCALEYLRLYTGLKELEVSVAGYHLPNYEDGLRWNLRGIVGEHIVLELLWQKKTIPERWAG
jgi:hypothetical protein